MSNIDRVAVLGAGVIGASWAALFSAGGTDVRVFDVSPDAERTVRDRVEGAWPTLIELGLAREGRAGDLSFHNDPTDAVKNAGFVQESVPERLDLKHALFREIEPHLAPDCVVASSASGLLVREMQQGWQDPSRFILGHPFNPPHLIPLVELLGNDRTADGVLDIAETFYRRMGKVTIRVNKEVPGHVANRLQAALWREAIHLVESGVASVGDVDTAVWAGPGLRWAAMGPHMLFHLGAGPGGLGEFCYRYTTSFHRWWDDLGQPQLSDALAEQLSAGVQDEAAGESVESLSVKRDAAITDILKAKTGLR